MIVKHKLNNSIEYIGIHFNNIIYGHFFSDRVQY